MSPDKNELYNELTSSEGIDDLSNKDGINKLGNLIDVSGDLKRIEGNQKALGWANDLELRILSSPEKVLLAYFKANAWSNIRHIKHQDRNKAWEWEQPEIQEEILCLRQAINEPGFEEIDSLRVCQIYTNLANHFNTIGRCVEAIPYWKSALTINPQFGIALGALGYGFENYAKALSDNGHRILFLKFAHKNYSKAVDPLAYYESTEYDKPKNYFRSQMQWIADNLDLNAVDTIDLNNHPMGVSKEEIGYRNWCLKNHLFLNSLNDLGALHIANRDILVLPTYTTPANEPPTLIGFFNQLKQEFVSARWFFYEGLDSDKVHFSDSGVYLFNTMDYPCYSLPVEKVKAAYRIAYSIFDKIGYFLNDYMALGISTNKVTFRTIWYEKFDHAQPLKNKVREQFTLSENWPLRGLFWLSKDLYEKSITDVIEPEARLLSEIRNHLEHKYLKVHEMLGADNVESSPFNWKDRMAFSITRHDLEVKTIKLLHLSRAALIYLSLGMHREEARRQAKDGKGKSIEIDLDKWDDAWKR